MLQLTAFRLKPAAQVRAEAQALEARIAGLFAPVQAEADRQVARAREAGLICERKWGRRLGDQAVRS